MAFPTSSSVSRAHRLRPPDSVFCVCEAETPLPPESATRAAEGTAGPQAESRQTAVARIAPGQPERSWRLIGMVKVLFNIMRHLLSRLRSNCLHVLTHGIRLKSLSAQSTPAVVPEQKPMLHETLRSFIPFQLEVVRVRQPFAIRTCPSRPLATSRFMHYEPKYALAPRGRPKERPLPEEVIHRVVHIELVFLASRSDHGGREQDVGPGGSGPFRPRL